MVKDTDMTHTAAQATPQITFPGQAAAPPGAVDLLPMYLMHHAFRRDLDKFAAAVERTPVGDRTTWRALDRRWAGFARILHLHHSGEDTTLWPLLLSRVDAAGDPAGRACLEAMEGEHAEIDPLLEACAAGFDLLAGRADEDARAALAVRLSAARERLGHHLAHEESEAMVLVQTHLTQAEWHSLDEPLREHYTARDQFFALPWVLLELPAETRPQVMAFVGRSGALLWHGLLRQPFERRERTAFRWA